VHLYGMSLVKRRKLNLVSEKLGIFGSLILSRNRPLASNYVE